MATKTISIDLEAYQKLKRARTSRKESFSQVIHRAEWRKHAPTCGDLLDRIEALEPMSEDGISLLERAQVEDRAPPNKWED